MIYVLLFILSFYLGFTVPYYIYRFIQKRRLVKEYNSLIPTHVIEERLCKDKHEWTEAVGIKDNDNCMITICNVCGFLPSTNSMATKETLSRLKENRKIREIETKIEVEFESLEQETIKALFEEMKKEPTYEKLYDAYLIGQSYSKRYTLHRIVSMKDVQKEET